jgi:hypothetical protein
MFRRKLIYSLIPITLVGCALNDVPSGTIPAPVTVQAPPALTFQGDCTRTKTLELWLEVTTQLVDQFQSTMNEAITKGRTAIYADVQQLIALRDAAYTAPAPDCTADTHLILTDTMNNAVIAFQNYYNQTQPDINATLVMSNSQFDSIRDSQKVLTQQMTLQFQNQLTTPTPST